MRVAVGLSGGVDSCVAAWLLKEAGHEVVGITMSVWREGLLPKGLAGKACFGPEEKESIAVAARFAETIGIPYRVFSCGERYEAEILAYFRETYLSGETPNPCVKCNAVMKFGLLPRLAAEAGFVFDKFATGHYARVCERNGRQMLLRAKDVAKDQSYFLCRLSQEQLARQLFPLGGFTKAEVRSLAAEAGLAVAERPDSQDFYTGDRDDLLARPPAEGEVVTVDGHVIGHHAGFWHYTVGQRKGLGVGGGTPFYVVALDAEHNRVVVGPRAAALQTTLRVTDLNWVSIAPTDGPFACRVKIRSTGEPLGPAVYEKGVLTSEAPLFGVTPGQYAVLYDEDGEKLLAGGLIRHETDGVRPPR